MQQDSIRKIPTRRVRLAVGVVVVAVSAGLFTACQLRDETDPTGGERKSQDGLPGPSSSPSPETTPQTIEAPSPLTPEDGPRASEGSKAGKGTGKQEDEGSTKRGATSPNAGSDAEAEDPDGWRTLWRDDFTDLDSSRWNVRDYGQAPNQEALFMRDNVKVDQGLLHLRAKKQDVAGWNYTSGYVDSNDKAALPDEFRLEVRAKVPVERGLWPAPLWLRPDDRSSGEIDLIETFGREVNDPATHHTVHTAYGPGREQDVEVKKYSELPGTADGWHVYSMVKTPGSIRMWVDGVPTATFKSGEPSWFDRYYEVGKSWNIRINLNVGGDWNGMPDHTTDWSASESVMHLDYIHTWVRD
ncbi:glycoside hydrolase family 16 protein [Nocardioides albus]|uniref:Beta-glucanase (GH16 family) n=1 Tax=Nocardioides albus TaxID=1841 RepID=A0A7W5A8K2_9ACTN|nr:glycoside hydrolase family 16 protein [Nocardioides albus]MBB3091485.1 beta-glucanase (GH16 family) [Nocardioides albus]GGU41482.1 hypothetical protein GCM10007979_45920 [Nocardioides albus]